MENKNLVIIIILLTLIIGLLLGYFFGTNTMPHRGFFSGDIMQEEMKEHMYGDEVIDGDGAMRHVMEEMMFGFRGLEGEAYEKMFLRSMIVHHLGAVQMTEELLEQTDRPELRVFAENLIEVQSREIETMRGWLETWFDHSN